MPSLSLASSVHMFVKSHNKLYYFRGTMQHTASVETLPTAAQLQEQAVQESITNRSNGVTALRWTDM